MTYIDNHITNVKEAFHKYGHTLCLVSRCNVDELETIVLQHDKSKYTPAEFEGYRRKYYPTDAEKNSDVDKLTADELSDKAWIHHFTFNRHHPEHWVVMDPVSKQPICTPMPKIYILEMILDWTAMGKINDKGNAWEYWNRERDNKIMHPDTKALVDTYIECVKDGL